MNEFFRRVAMMNRDMPKSTKNIYIGIFILLIGYIGFQIFKTPTILISIAALYFAIVLHEIAHGAMAYAYGDPTAKIAGRLTLNPLKHIDIIGTIVPIVLILIGAPFLFGWAKPVPVNFKMLKKKNTGMFMVAIAGVTVNLILAFTAALVYTLILQKNMSGLFPTIVESFVIYSIKINVVLMIFNLIPIPPLDGSRVIYAFADFKVRNFLDSVEPYGTIIILFLMAVNIFDKVLYPIAVFVINNIIVLSEYIAAML